MPRLIPILFCASLINSPLLLTTGLLRAASPEVLFDGSNTEQWDFADGAWVIEDDGSLSCRMKEVKQKNGQIRLKGMGYIWTQRDFGDFELSLSYKLSPGANSGVFYRSNPKDPVQQGFEIQLMDNKGFQKVKGPKDAKNLNGSIYDAKAPTKDVAKPLGEWNRLKLTCRGPIVKVEINGVAVNEANLDLWDTPQKNPDGSKNKFKTALRDLPRQGRIGLQNHGQVVWFKDIVIQPL